MNLDDILELAAARTPSSLDRARARRAAERVLREYAEATAEGRNLLGDLDVEDVLAPDADEATRITRVAQSAKTGWIKWTAATGELTWSDEMSRLFGYPAVTTHVPVETLIKGVHQEDFTRVKELVEQGWRHQIPQEFSFRVLRADGAMRYAGCLVELLGDDGREPTGIVATVRDITRQELERQEIDRRRRRRVTETDLPGRDTVSGMLGRDRFADELDRAARGGQGTLLVVAVEPDRELSEAQSEQVTRTVTGILDEITDSLCGALGSGEFGMVLGDVGHAREVAGAVLGCLHQRRTLAISAGVRLRAWAALVPFARADRAGGQDLLLDASWAWREGRRDGDMLKELPGPREAGTREAATRRMIAAMVGDDRLCLHAQAILDLTLNEITRHEVLVRVLDEHGRPELPAAFLAVAERFDQIGAVDRWVVEQSLALIGQGPQTSHHQINLSGRTLSRPGLAEFVIDALDRHGVDPRTITFEITESAAVDNLAAAAEFAAGVRSRGCGLALDDFGTGHSSLMLLKYLPIDLVKIDGVFVTGLRDSAFDRIAVRHVVQLCRELGVRTAAEFAEDAATVELLRDMGLDFAQGYAIARPLPMAATPAAAAELAAG
ncbi:EAL domain-containing protein [Actinoplanes sp. NPDC049668]|uniref:EAL domain-containing protein n=1 Tax=unclassified Actinoplanes TaxID=2626549 RepID=UPI0033ADACB6